MEAGRRWDEAVVAQWEADLVVPPAHYKLESLWAAAAEGFTVKIKGAEGVVLEIFGTLLGGKSFSVSFKTSAGDQFLYDEKAHAIRKAFKGASFYETRDEGEIVLAAKSGIKRKPGVTRWERPKTPKAQSPGEYTDISKVDEPSSDASLIPKIFSVGRALGGRVIALDGHYPDIFTEDLEELTENACAKRAGDLLARVEGDFPFGTLAENMSGQRDFTITCGPAVQAMSAADRGLFLAGLTVGFWKPAAGGSSWAAISSGTYGLRPPQ